MRRKDEPARERAITPWRPDSEMRSAVEKFCKKHRIENPKGGTGWQEFLDRAANMMLERGAKGLSEQEQWAVERFLTCYRAETLETEFLLGLLEKKLGVDKKG